MKRNLNAVILLICMLFTLAAPIAAGGSNGASDYGDTSTFEDVWMLDGMYDMSYLTLSMSAFESYLPEGDMLDIPVYYVNEGSLMFAVADNSRNLRTVKNADIWAMLDMVYDSTLKVDESMTSYYDPAEYGPSEHMAGSSYILHSGVYACYENVAIATPECLIVCGGSARYGQFFRKNEDILCASVFGDNLKDYTIPISGSDKLCRVIEVDSGAFFTVETDYIDVDGEILVYNGRESIPADGTYECYDLLTHNIGIIDLDTSVIAADGKSLVGMPAMKSGGSYKSLSDKRLTKVDIPDGAYFVEFTGSASLPIYADRENPMAGGVTDMLDGPCIILVGQASLGASSGSTASGGYPFYSNDKKYLCATLYGENLTERTMTIQNETEVAHILTMDSGAYFIVEDNYINVDGKVGKYYGDESRPADGTYYRYDIFEHNPFIEDFDSSLLASDGASFIKYPHSTGKSGYVGYNDRNVKSLIPDGVYLLDFAAFSYPYFSDPNINADGGGGFMLPEPYILVVGDAALGASSGAASRPNFTDVPSGEYYAEPVAWAVANGITLGTSDTTFSPNSTCTRGQIITFLWRAAGSPAPNAYGYFYDVPDDSQYYSAAVSWAKEAGILSGVNFQPNADCTRAMVVEFLWRFFGSPNASTAAAFVDVPYGAAYADAVSWAVENGITAGTSTATFSPDMTCTRGQIVTFLWRAFV